MDNKPPIDITHLKQLDAVIDAALERFAVKYDLIKPYLSMNEAYKKYGRGTVDRWIAEGLINPIKDGTGTSKRRIERKQIELLAAMSNRSSWFENHE